jgi:hypothetical protein
MQARLDALEARVTALEIELANVRGQRAYGGEAGS